MMKSCIGKFACYDEHFCFSDSKRIKLKKNILLSCLSLLLMTYDIYKQKKTFTDYVHWLINSFSVFLSVFYFLSG